MARTGPDIPLDAFSVEDIERIATDVQEAEAQVEDALAVLDGEDCVARDKLAEAYGALTYLETAMDGIVTLKLRGEAEEADA